MCEREKELRDEHVIPWWVEVLLHDWGPFTDGVGDELLDTTDKWLNIKMLLCSSCNCRFGKKFEEQASRILKPMIRSCPTDSPTMLLTPADQKTVGRWIVKTLMLRGFMEGIDSPTIYWDWLRCRGPHETGGMPLPPAGTHVWVAKYPRTTQKETHLQDGALEPTYEPRFDWKTQRFHVGEVAMFVLHQRVEVDGTFTHPAEHFEMLTRVLPQHDGPVEWPPRKRIGKADIAQINDAILVPGL